MSIPQIVITALVIAGFLAMGIWALTYGRKIKYPDGIRVTMHARTPSMRVVTVLDGDIEGMSSSEAEDIAWACTDAVECAAIAWHKEGMPGNPWKSLELFCCWIRTERAYENDVLNWKEFVKHTAAYLAQVPRAIGSGPPMAVIREKYIFSIKDFGQPVIHEALHHLAREYTDPMADRNHVDERIWEDVAAAAIKVFDERRRV